MASSYNITIRLRRPKTVSLSKSGERIYYSEHYLVNI